MSEARERYEEPTAGWWDHERLPDWQYAVGNGDTTRGFAEWLRVEGVDEDEDEEA